LIAIGLLDPFWTGVLLPGLVGALVAGSGFFVPGVGLEGVGLEGVVFDGAGLVVEVVVLVCVFVPAVLDVGVFGLGLDKGVLVVAGFGAERGAFDIPFDAEACAFLVALAARSLLVLVGLGLSVLGTGDGRVKGVVLVDSGVLAVVGVFVVPAVAGLELGALAGAELGFAVWGLDVGVFVEEGVVVGLAEAGLVVG